MASPNEGDAVALAWGADLALFLSTERMIAGAKITETMASTKVSTMTNATIMKIALANRDSPLLVAFEKLRVLPRILPTHAGGVGLPIVSA